MLRRFTLLLVVLSAVLPGCTREEKADEPVLLLPVLQGPGWGYMSKDGKTWVREPQYEAAEILVNGFGRINYGGLWGFINDRGEEILEPTFDLVLRFSEGKGAVMIEGSWGFVDTSGAVAIPLKFERVSPFSDSLAVAQRDSLQGYINHEGTFVIEPIYALAGDFIEGAARVSESGQLYGLIRKDETLVAGRWFEDLRPPSEGRFAYQWGGRWGFMDMDGNVVVEPEYQYTQDYSEGRCVVGNAPAQEFGVVDLDGNFVVEIGRYTFIRPYQEGYAKVRRDGGWGFIDLEGNEVIEPRFNVAYREFVEGVAAYRDTTGQWGFIDKQGEVFIEPQFQEAYDFQQGVCLVRNNSLRGYINLKGEYIVEPSF